MGDVEWIWNVVDLLEERKRKMNGDLYLFLYDAFSINWYHRHWKAYEQMERMEVWDKILNECRKPLDFVKNEMELIELLMQYGMVSEEECKLKLNMKEKEIDNLKQLMKIKKEKEM